MDRKLYLITGRDKFLGQFRKPWVSLDVKIFEEELANSGWKYKVCEFHQVANGICDIRDSFIFYTFSQKVYYLNYLKDIVYYLKLRNNILIPPYELLLCQENKGFQDLYKKVLKIDELKSLYVSDLREIDNYSIDYPVVVKTITGSNANGVFLAKNKEELQKAVRSFTPVNTIGEKLDLIRRKYFRFKKKVNGWPEFESRQDYHLYKEYIRKSKNFVIQKFISDLEHDFRVLYVAGHYYVTKRHVRKGDFRASGSKLFDFDTGDVQPLLDYAENLIKKFNMPYLSIDLAKVGNNIHLLEYQANHFGNNVIKLSSGYYLKEANNWKFITEKPDVSRVLAKGLVRYLDNIHDVHVAR